MFKSLPYDSLKSFAPVGLAAKSPLVVVPPSLPVNSVKELIAYAKSKKDGITYASPGAGTPLHLAGELFSKAVGVEMLHIPYKGSAPALNDLIAAVNSACSSPPTPLFSRRIVSRKSSSQVCEAFMQSLFRRGPLALTEGMALSFTAVGLFIATGDASIGIDASHARSLSGMVRRHREPACAALSGG